MEMKRWRILHCCVALALLSWGWTASAQSPNVPSAQDISALKKQAAARNVKAQLDLSGAYYLGRNIPQSYSKATYWSRKAAEQGNPIAQYNLGIFYKEGQGVPQSFQQSAFWFRKAAKQGYASAQLSLGLACEAGDMGVPPDYSQAVVWYRKAAEQGVVEAQVQLGNLYLNGHLNGWGVPIDYTEAYFWLDLAAAVFKQEPGVEILAQEPAAGSGGDSGGDYYWRPETAEDLAEVG